MLKLFKRKTIIDRLNDYLSTMTHEQKIDHLKTIIPMVVPGVNVSKNPKKRKNPDGRLEA